MIEFFFSSLYSILRIFCGVLIIPTALDSLARFKNSNFGLTVHCSSTVMIARHDDDDDDDIYIYNLNSMSFQFFILHLTQERTEKKKTNIFFLFIH